MQHPYLKNRTLLLIYAAIWTLLGVTLGVVLIPLLPVPYGYSIATGVIFALVFGGVSLPLWDVAAYGRRMNIDRNLRFVWNAGLGALTLMAWFGLSVALTVSIFSGRLFSAIVPALPSVAAAGILAYAALIQYYVGKMDCAEEEEQSCPPPAPTAEERPAPETDALKQVAVKSGRRIEITPVSEILYIQAEGDYVMIYTSGQRFLKEQTMKYFEQNLPEGHFVRIHRSYIVNVKAISRVERYGKQEQIVVLNDGKKIKASQNGYRELKRVLDL